MKALGTLFLISGFCLAISQGLPSQGAVQCGRYCQGDSNQFGYELNKNYEYNYEGLVRTLINSTDSDESGVQLSCRVTFRALGSCDHMMEIADVAFGDFYVRGARKTVPEDQQKYDSIKKLLVANPLYFSFAGKIDTICFEPEELKEIVDIKRGILSAFQNSNGDFRKSALVYESDIAGNCETSYEVKELDGHKFVSKVKNLNACHHRKSEYSSWQTVSFMMNSNARSLPLLRSSFNCDLEYNDQNILISSNCFEKHLFQPFSNGDHGAVTSVHQKLAFLKSVEDYKRITPSRTHKKGSLMHSFSVEITGSSDKAIAMAILQDLEEKTTDGIEYDVPAKFSALIEEFQLMTVEDLLETFDAITRKQRKFYVDAISSLTTTAGIEVMNNLYKDSKIGLNQMNSWIMSLNFMKSPTKNTIAAALPLIDHEDIKKNTILAVSSLIYKYCKTVPNCLEDSIVVNALIIIETPLSESCIPSSTKSRNEMLLSLKGLGNAGLTTDFDILRRCYSDPDVLLELRLAAIASHRRTNCAENINLDDFKNILANIRENSEVRIASYLASMQCASYAFFAQVKDILLKEETNQVGSFVWTHLTNLQETSMHWKQDIRRLTENEFLKNKFNTDFRKYSRNFEASAFLDSVGVGGGIEANVIFSSESYLPRSAMLNFTLDLFGETINLLEIGTRLKGFEPLVENLFGPDGHLADETISGYLETAKSDYEKYRNINDVHESLKILEGQPTGSAYAKIFGNEFSYLQFNDIDELIGGSMNSQKLLELLMKLAKENEIDYTKSATLLDSSYKIPTVLGLTLELDAKGTATVGLVAQGDVDAKNLWSHKMLLKGKLYPSLSVDISATMTVNTLNSKTGLRYKGTLNSNSYIDGYANIELGKIVDVKINVPKKQIDVMTITSDVYVVNNDFSFVGKDISENIAKSEYCTPEIVSKLCGVRICNQYRYVNASVEQISPSFPLTGSFNYSLNIQKTDTFDFYHFYLKTNPLDGMRTHYFMNLTIDTPNSQIDRTVQAIVNLDVAKYKFNASLITPLIKFRVISSLTRTTTNYTFDVHSHLNNKDFVVLHSTVNILNSQFGYKFQPVLQLNYKEKEVMAVSGNYSRISNGKYQANLKMLIWGDEELLLSGSFITSADFANLEMDIQSKDLSGNLLSELTVVPTMISFKNRLRYLYKKLDEQLSTFDLEVGKTRNFTVSSDTLKLEFLNSQFPNYDTYINIHNERGLYYFNNIGILKFFKASWRSQQLFKANRNILRKPEIHVLANLECPQKNINYEAGVKYQHNKENLIAHSILQVTKDLRAEGLINYNFTDFQDKLNVMLYYPKHTWTMVGDFDKYSNNLVNFNFSCSHKTPTEDFTLLHIEGTFQNFSEPITEVEKYTLKCSVVYPEYGVKKLTPWTLFGSLQKSDNLFLSLVKISNKLDDYSGYVNWIKDSFALTWQSNDKIIVNLNMAKTSNSMNFLCGLNIYQHFELSAMLVMPYEKFVMHFYWDKDRDEGKILAIDAARNALKGHYKVEVEYPNQRITSSFILMPTQVTMNITWGIQISQRIFLKMGNKHYDVGGMWFGELETPFFYLERQKFVVKYYILPESFEVQSNLAWRAQNIDMFVSGLKAEDRLAANFQVNTTLAEIFKVETTFEHLFDTANLSYITRFGFIFNDDVIKANSHCKHLKKSISSEFLVQSRTNTIYPISGRFNLKEENNANKMNFTLNWQQKNMSVSYNLKKEASFVEIRTPFDGLERTRFEYSIVSSPDSVLWSAAAHFLRQNNSVVFSWTNKDNHSCFWLDFLSPATGRYYVYFTHSSLLGTLRENFRIQGPENKDIVQVKLEGQIMPILEMNLTTALKFFEQEASFDIVNSRIPLSSHISVFWDKRTLSFDTDLKFRDSSLVYLLIKTTSNVIQPIKIYYEQLEDLNIIEINLVNDYKLSNRFLINSKMQDEFSLKCSTMNITLDINCHQNSSGIYHKLAGHINNEGVEGHVNLLRRFYDVSLKLPYSNRLQAYANLKEIKNIEIGVDAVFDQQTILMKGTIQDTLAKIRTNMSVHSYDLTLDWGNRYCLNANMTYTQLYNNKMNYDLFGLISWQNGSTELVVKHLDAIKKSVISLEYSKENLSFVIDIPKSSYKFDVVAKSKGFLHFDNHLKKQKLYLDYELLNNSINAELISTYSNIPSSLLKASMADAKVNVTLNFSKYKFLMSNSGLPSTLDFRTTLTYDTEELFFLKSNYVPGFSYVSFKYNIDGQFYTLYFDKVFNDNLRSLSLIFNSPNTDEVKFLTRWEKRHKQFISSMSLENRNKVIGDVEILTSYLSLLESSSKMNVTLFANNYQGHFKIDWRNNISRTFQIRLSNGTTHINHFDFFWRPSFFNVSTKIDSFNLWSLQMLNVNYKLTNKGNQISSYYKNGDNDKVSINGHIDAEALKLLVTSANDEELLNLEGSHSFKNFRNFSIHYNAVYKRLKLKFVLLNFFGDYYHTKFDVVTPFRELPRLVLEYKVDNSKIAITSLINSRAIHLLAQKNSTDLLTVQYAGETLIEVVTNDDHFIIRTSSRFGRYRLFIQGTRDPGIYAFSILRGGENFVSLMLQNYSTTEFVHYKGKIIAPELIMDRQNLSVEFQSSHEPVKLFKFVLKNNDGAILDLRGSNNITNSSYEAKLRFETMLTYLPNFSFEPKLVYLPRQHYELDVNYPCKQFSQCNFHILALPDKFEIVSLSPTETYQNISFRNMGKLINDKADKSHFFKIETDLFHFSYSDETSGKLITFLYENSKHKLFLNVRNIWNENLSFDFDMAKTFNWRVQIGDNDSFQIITNISSPRDLSVFIGNSSSYLKLTSNQQPNFVQYKLIAPKFSYLKYFDLNLFWNVSADIISLNSLSLDSDTTGNVSAFGNFKFLQDVLDIETSFNAPFLLGLESIYGKVLIPKEFRPIIKLVTPNQVYSFQFDHNTSGDKISLYLHAECEHFMMNAGCNFSTPYSTPYNIFLKASHKNYSIDFTNHFYTNRKYFKVIIETPLKQYPKLGIDMNYHVEEKDKGFAMLLLLPQHDKPLGWNLQLTNNSKSGLLYPNLVFEYQLNVPYLIQDFNFLHFYMCSKFEEEIRVEVNLKNNLHNVSLLTEILPENLLFKLNHNENVYLYGNLSYINNSELLAIVGSSSIDKIQLAVANLEAYNSSIHDNLNVLYVSDVNILNYLSSGGGLFGRKYKMFAYNRWIPLSFEFNIPLQFKIIWDLREPKKSVVGYIFNGDSWELYAPSNELIFTGRARFNSTRSIKYWLFRWNSHEIVYSNYYSNTNTSSNMIIESNFLVKLPIRTIEIIQCTNMSLDRTATIKSNVELIWGPSNASKLIFNNDITPGKLVSKLISPALPHPITLCIDMSQFNSVPSRLKAQLSYSSNPLKDIHLQMLYNRRDELGHFFTERSFIVKHPISKVDYELFFSANRLPHYSNGNVLLKYFDFNFNRSETIETFFKVDHHRFGIHGDVLTSSNRFNFKAVSTSAQKRRGFLMNVVINDKDPLNFEFVYNFKQESPSISVLVGQGDQRKYIAYAGMPNVREITLKLAHEIYGKAAIDGLVMMKLNTSQLLWIKLYRSENMYATFHQAILEEYDDLKFVIEATGKQLIDVIHDDIGKGIRDDYMEIKKLVLDYVEKEQNAAMDNFNTVSFVCTRDNYICVFLQEHVKFWPPIAKTFRKFINLFYDTISEVLNETWQSIKSVFDDVGVEIERAMRQMKNVKLMKIDAKAVLRKGISVVRKSLKGMEMISVGLVEDFDQYVNHLRESVEVFFEPILTLADNFIAYVEQRLAMLQIAVLDTLDTAQHYIFNLREIKEMFLVYASYINWLEELHVVDMLEPVGDVLEEVLETIIRDIKISLDHYKPYLDAMGDVLFGKFESVTKLPPVSDFKRALNGLYQKTVWIWNYHNMTRATTSFIRTFCNDIDILLQYLEFDNVSDEELDYSLSKSFVVKPESGLVEISQPLPVVWEAFNKAPSFNHYPLYETIHDKSEQFVKFYKNRYDLITMLENFVIDLYEPSISPSTFNNAMIIGKSQYTTFNGFNYNFISNCSFLLAGDFKSKSFSLVVNYGNNEKSYEVIVDGGTIEIFSDRKVLLNGEQTDLPIVYNQVAVTREKFKVLVESVRGFRMSCNFYYDYCEVQLSGWLFGKTAGLFGTLDNELLTDTMSSWKNQSQDLKHFLNSWKLQNNCFIQDSPLSLLNSTADSMENICDLVFSNDQSPLSKCFDAVKTDAFRDACYLEMRTSAEPKFCNSVGAYVRLCKKARVPIEMLDICVSCEHHIDISGATYDGHNNKTLDVVFISELDCFESPQIKQLAADLDRRLRDNGFEDNRFANVAYGGSTLPKPHVYTVGGNVWTGAESLHLKNISSSRAIVKRKFDGLSAIKFAVNMDFRPGVSKLFVLFQCETSKDLSQSSAIYNLLGEKDITLHVLKPEALRNYGKMLHGISANLFIPPIKGDLQSVLTNMEDLYNILALGTNGTVFDLNKVLGDSEGRRSWAETVGKYARKSPCQKCRCTEDQDGIAKIECSRCLAPAVKQLLNEYEAGHSKLALENKYPMSV